MRVPQVSERNKEAPAQALRGVFAGIGQLLLITDRLRNKAPADVPRPRTPERSQPVADATVSEPAVPQERAAEPAAAQPAAAKPSSVKSAPAKGAAAKPSRAPRTRDFDKTGNVRLLDDAETAAAMPVSATPAAAAPVRPAPVSPASAAAAPAAVGSKPGDSGPPLPNYDELSVASLRARLRNLDVAQVRQLAEYERAHAARADVVGMFERRIAKLEADA